MIVHNLEDDNVLFQNTVQMTAALTEAGKPYELRSTRRRPTPLPEPRGNTCTRHWLSSSSGICGNVVMKLLLALVLSGGAFRQIWRAPGRHSGAGADTEGAGVCVVVYGRIQRAGAENTVLLTYSDDGGATFRERRDGRPNEGGRAFDPTCAGPGGRLWYIFNPETGTRPRTEFMRGHARSRTPACRSGARVSGGVR